MGYNGTSENKEADMQYVLTAYILGFMVSMSGGLAQTEAAPSTTQPATKTEPISGEKLKQKIGPMMDRALKFQAAGQREDGGWAGFKPDESDPAITALVAQTFIQQPDYGQ